MKWNVIVVNVGVMDMMMQNPVIMSKKKLLETMYAKS